MSTRISVYNVTRVEAGSYTHSIDRDGNTRHWMRDIVIRGAEGTEQITITLRGDSKEALAPKLDNYVTKARGS